VNLNRSWVSSSPLMNPDWYKAKSTRENWPEGRKRDYEKRIDRLRQLAERHANATSETGKEMHVIASFITARWRQR